MIGKIIIGGFEIALNCDNKEVSQALTNRFGDYFGAKGKTVLKVNIAGDANASDFNSTDVFSELTDHGIKLSTGGAVALLNHRKSELTIHVNTKKTSASVTAIENTIRPSLQYLFVTKKLGLFIHSGSAVHKRQGVLFPGYSGAGKSTLSKILYAQGDTIFSDDFSIIVYQNGKYWICGSPFFGSEKNLPRIKGKAPLKSIFFLRQSKKIEIKKINQSATARALISNIPFAPLLGSNFVVALLDLTRELSQSVSGFEFYFVRNELSADFLHKHLKSLK